MTHARGCALSGAVDLHSCESLLLRLALRAVARSERLTISIMSDLIPASELKTFLKQVPVWEHDKKKIERVFEFDDFTDAMDFVNQVAEIAEESEHHPDIEVKFNKVKLVLTTHSKGGLTELDFELAEKIDTLVDE